MPLLDNMSYDQFIDYCWVQNATVIFVRAKKDGKWQSVSLDQLGYEKAMILIDDWWNERKLPIIMLES